MRYKFLFWILILIAIGFFPALKGWAADWIQVDSPTTLTLNASDYSYGHYYAAGESGVILFSSGGKNWYQVGISTSLDFYDLDAVGGAYITAVGERGVIFYSSDYGETWDRLTANVTNGELGDYNLYGIKMVNSTYGYMVGEDGLVLKTDDSGESWEELGQITSVDLYEVAVASSTEVWTIGEGGVILHTEDGGKSWETQDSDTNYDLLGIDFVDSNHGFIVGHDGIFLATTNGGEDWETIDIDLLSSDEEIRAVDFYDANHGLIEAEGGKHLITKNGGVDWEAYDLPDTETIFSVSSFGENGYFSVGYSGVIFRYDANAPSKPESFTVDSGSPSSDATPLFTWKASTDSEGDIDHYEIKMDSGSYENVGNRLSYSYPEVLSDGSHTAYLKAVDEADNSSPVTSKTFTVDSDDNDNLGPAVGKIFPTTGVEDFSLVFRTEVSEEAVDCDLYIDGDYEKGMALRDGWASVSYAFGADGDYSVYARCVDIDGNAVNGTAATVSIENKSDDQEPGDLIKTACDAGAVVNDPCTAVYYYGADGQRHAFPNEAVYKSWYNDFDDLVILSDAAMAAIPLGPNVTYRPASYLIKFSPNTVYAISYGGVLRAIDNEEIAAAIFGNDWTKKIMVISDVFYGNYEIGETIDSSRDFDESAVKDSANNIDDLF